MKTGDRVHLMVGSANHDELEFDTAEELILDRPQAHSVVFGQGAHYCIGAALARLETQISLRALQRQMPNLQLAADRFEYQPVFFLRALKSVPISIGN